MSDLTVSYQTEAENIQRILGYSPGASARLGLDDDGYSEVESGAPAVSITCLTMAAMTPTSDVGTLKSDSSWTLRSILAQRSACCSAVGIRAIARASIATVILAALSF